MTGDGGFEAVEQAVQQCVERIEGTPYLAPGMALVFLEELAHDCVEHGARATSVSTVAAAKRLIWPAGMSLPDRHAAVAALLTESGVATVTHDQLEFANEGACRYLGARHVVRHHPKGPGRWMSRAAKHLRPRSAWTEQDAELARFLVILWWRNARAAVVRQLGKLLEEPHRYPNIFLVAELCGQGLLSDSDLCARTTTILRAEVSSARRPDKAWQAMVESLHSLDPATAVYELERVARSPRSGMTVTRQFTAVTELIKHDHALGAAHLAYLADHLTGAPDDQVAVAVRIAAIDHDLGVRTLTRLARDPDLGDSRVDAALTVDSPQLWCELIPDPALADDGRLRVLTRLLDRDRGAALAVVPAFVDTVHEERSRLHIAELVEKHDRSMAWQLAYDVAWTTDRRVDGWVRLDGVLLLGRFDPTQALALLEHFSAWSAVAGEIRLRAAVAVIEQGGMPTALAALAHADGVARPHRVEAAERLGQLDRAGGADAYIAIAATCARSERARLDLLRAALALAPEPAAKALATVAGDRRFPDEIRVEAVTIAGPALTGPQRIHLYSAIVQTATKDGTAMAVARRVKAVDVDAGERLMADLARRNMQIELRLEAAEAAGRHGEHVLVDFAHRSRPAWVRLRAAKALGRIDPRTSDKLLRELAQTRRIGSVRVEAAQELAQPTMFRCLSEIVGDRKEREDVRYEAGVAVMRQDPHAGRRLLMALADSGVSRRMQSRITQLLR